MPRKPLRAGTPRPKSTGDEKQRRKKRRQSVGAVMGVTPGGRTRGHLGDAAAIQEAAGAAEALDQLRIEPSSRTARKNRRSKSKVKERSKTRSKGSGKPARESRPLPRAFTGDSPFLWHTIDAFNTPTPDGDQWMWGEHGDQETKQDSAAKRHVPKDSEDETHSPTDSEDREFVKSDQEGESPDDLPPTDEEEFNEDSDYVETEDHDGGSSSDTLSEDEPPRRKKGPEKKTRKAPKKPKPPDPKPPDPSSSSSEESTDSSSFSHQSSSEQDRRSRKRKSRRRRKWDKRSYGATRYAPAAVMYNPPDEKKNPAPVLRHGDPDAKKLFRPKYKKYVAKHKSDQRSIPPAYRVAPKAVVECIEPTLLMQICRLELAKKYRTKKPEDVSAMAVHKWVMGEEKLPIELEDNEGVQKMRALKCTIDATSGLRNVQELFMKVFEYRETYRMRTSQQEIIKWLSQGIKPNPVKYTVLNALRVEGKRGRARRKRLTTFHRLLKKLAKKFYEAKALGLNIGGTDKPDPKPTVPPPKPKPKPSPNPKDKDKDKDKDRDKGGDKDGPPKRRTFKCFHCGKDHKVAECPTCPADKKAWSPARWYEEKKAQSKKAGASASGDPGGGKKALHLDEGDGSKASGKRGKQEKLGSVADGPATVAGVEGFWTADGGCNKATISANYAKNLATAGVKVVEYDKWKMAQLADGTRKPIISGYCVADIVLRTKAGKVVLPHSHIDILQGPESGNLLYMGQAEESRLGLKSYKKQIEELAGKIQRGEKEQLTAEDSSNPANSENKCKVAIGGKVRTVRFEAGKQPVFKRRLRLGATDDEFGHEAGEVKADGYAFVGEQNWLALEKTPYVMDPMCQGVYITTAAVRGQDLKLAKDPPPNPVKTYDLSQEMQDWVGDKVGAYTCEVQLDLRVGPDANNDTVERQSTLKQVTVKVIESEVPAVILGHDKIEELAERKNESLEFKEDRTGEVEKIKQRLEDVCDAARLQGMSPAGIEEGRKMIQQEFPDIWRLSLGPNDYADVPPLEMELIDPDQRLPKPYTKRYTKAELAWWKKHTDALLKAGIIRRSASTDLSPANLVDKFRDGVAMLDDHRMVIDLRGRNANAKTRHYHLPRLDDLWQHLLGAKVFASVDATKGYLQFLLAVASRKFAGFLTPFGAFESCRVLMGWVDSASYYQEMMTGVLGDLLYACVLQYLDDGLIFAGEERGLLDALRAYFTVLQKHNIKLHPGKFVLFAKNLTWGGKDLKHKTCESSSPVGGGDARTFDTG